MTSISQTPLTLDDSVEYETRPIRCARCGQHMPHAPFPTNSQSPFHRPRCGNCGSMFTYPVDQPN